MGRSNLASNLASKTSSVLVVTLIVVLLDLLLAFYVTSHGFQPATNGIAVAGMTIQLQWLPVVGMVIVSLAAAYDAFSRIFPRWLGPEADPIARLRFLRAVAVSVVAFVSLLYVPYLLGSGWFWRHLSHVSHALSPLQGFGAWLETVELPILSLNPVYQYSVAQILASAALVLVPWVLARPAKRPRRIK